MQALANRVSLDCHYYFRCLLYRTGPMVMLFINVFFYLLVCSLYVGVQFV